MQRSFFLALGLLMAGFARGNDGVTTVSSTLKSAMVYRSGAELVHVATVRLTGGNNEVMVGDVSNSIDEGSIRIGCTGDVTVMSVGVATDYLRPAVSSAIVRKLQDSIAAIDVVLGRLDVQRQVDVEQLDLLSANKSLSGNGAGVTVAELSKMMDFYRQKGVELRTDLGVIDDKVASLKQLVEKLGSQIQENERKNSATGGSLVLRLLSPATQSCDLTISYLTKAARWEPAYDLDVKGGGDSLELRYKARLVQTSGIDWKRVKLSLSTSLPSLSGNAPVMVTKFLQFVEVENMLKRLPGLLVDKDAVAFGYGEAKSFRSGYLATGSIGSYVTVNDQRLDAVFDIDIPYDVPGNGKEEAVVLKEYELPCSYRYYAVPGQDHDVYLLGQLRDWEKLDLLPGEANLIVEGTYVGKSRVDPNSTRDTLDLTLGRDKQIVIHREKVVDYSSVKFLGSGRKQVFTYEITVKNNKRRKIDLQLKDQYPISTDKEIEEELLESSGATVDKDTGILTWEVELKAGESRKFRISYSVKYPKDRMLNIN
jgi:uncharacterized protein (TIGR02231 family)